MMTVTEETSETGSQSSALFLLDPPRLLTLPFELEPGATLSKYGVLVAAITGEELLCESKRFLSPSDDTEGVLDRTGSI